MPARNPIGAETSAATRTMGSVRRSGCQPAPQRMRTVIPKPIQPKRTNIHAPRRSPGPSSSRRTPPVGPVAAVVVKLCSSLLTGLLSGLHEERDEPVELRLRDPLAEVLGHDALRIARLDVGVRVDDRLVNERLERLLRLLRERHELVEVGPD